MKSQTGKISNRKIKAYSYTRFSTGIQMQGRSFKRQTESPEVLEFINHHNLDVVEKMVDAGVSGFTGKNFNNSAALGKFIEQIRQGAIERGSVLIVENLDRFSRDNITDCISRFTEIIRAGVSVGVVAMNIIIDLDQMNDNSMLWNYVSNEFQRARAESKRKSRFTKDVIQEKLANAAKGELVHFAAQSPSWVIGVGNSAGEKILKHTQDKKGVAWLLNAEKAAIVKRIFALYLTGESCNNIATIFNKESVPTLKNGTINNWSQSLVKQVLENRNVVGWCKVLEFENDDYYPQLVSPVDFEKVAVRLRFNSTTRGGTTERVPNLFRGLIFCNCGSAIDVISNHGGQYNYAYCRNAIMGKGCTCKTRVRMHLIEMAIFTTFKHPADLTLQPMPKNSALDKLKNQLATVEASINRIAELLTDPDLKDLPAFKTKLKQALAAKDVIVSQIKSEESKIIQVAELPKAVGALFSLFALGGKEKVMADSQKWMNSFTAYIKVLANRKIVRNLMPSVFERIVVSHTTKSKVIETDIICRLIGGGEIHTKLINEGKTGIYAIEEQ